MKYLKMLGLAAISAMAFMAFASTASATTLEVGGTTKDESVTISSSLSSGTSAILKNTSGTSQNTCTESAVHGDTVAPYSATHLNGTISSLTFNSCTRPVTVHDEGSLTVTWTSGTNGTVSSLGATVTVGVPLFGEVTCRTHEKTHLGTLTGEAVNHATLHVNASLDCGAIWGKWEATYVVTTPTGLGVIK